METLPNEIIAHIALIGNNNIGSLKRTCRQFYDAISSNYLCAERIKILFIRKKINEDIFYIDCSIDCLGDHVMRKEKYHTIYTYQRVDSQLINVYRECQFNGQSWRTNADVLCERVELTKCEYDDGYYIKVCFDWSQ